ncbi:MAG: EamA family transporter [Candidatus Aenigmarchaeota archaeon]|nr:EamA family transporter [Candidatus Aenigmarchaeota archaeon]
MLAGTIHVISAAVLIGLGLFIQKVGIKDSLRSAIKSPIWIFGTLVGLCGFGFYVVALMSERIAIVQSLMTLSLLVVAIAELLAFEEKATKNDIISIAMFMIGVVLIVLG